MEMGSLLTFGTLKFVFVEHVECGHFPEAVPESPQALGFLGLLWGSADITNTSGVLLEWFPLDPAFLPFCILTYLEARREWFLSKRCLSTRSQSRASLLSLTPGQEAEIPECWCPSQF